jgi:hypothetical protein
MIDSQASGVHVRFTRARHRRGEIAARGAVVDVASARGPCVADPRELRSTPGASLACLEWQTGVLIMHRHSHEDRHSQDRYLPGSGGANLSAGYRGSQDEREPRYQSGVHGYQHGGYQGGNYGNYQGGGYDRSQRGGYDRDDARGGNYGRGYDRDRDEGRGFAFQNNDYDRNYGGYARDVSGYGYGDRGYGDRFSESERGGAYVRDFGRSDDDRVRGDYNMYSRDSYDRRDYDRRDYDRRDYDRRDFDRRDFDRGPMGGYAERGSYAHDRDRGPWARDDRFARGHDSRGHGGYERSRLDDERMPAERRWR